MTKTVSERPTFQGDLMIQLIDSLPDGLEEVAPEGGYHVVAHSETGHNHCVMERPTTRMCRLPEEIYEAFLVVENEPATLEHHRNFDTHEPVQLPPGNYRIKRQREYTPEGFRRAAD